MSDIPSMPTRRDRLDEVLADCNGQAEELIAFENYFAEVLDYPFAAAWRDPDEDGHAEAVQVLGLDSCDDRRGILLAVKRGAKKRRVLAEQVWAADTESANATLLDDYRYWIDKMYGLTPGYER